MANEKTAPRDLRVACLDEAYRIIEERGIDNLSMRDVARRLGVSHQAPYKHFASREHILAEVISRIFDEFATHLDKSTPNTAHPFEDLHAMGIAYLRYADRNPLKYRLMFNSPLPEPDLHEGMMKNARKAFSILEAKLSALHLRPVEGRPEPAPQLDAMFIWSTLHGFASIMQSDTLDTLGMSRQDMKDAHERIMQRMSMAIQQM